MLFHFKREIIYQDRGKQQCLIQLFANKKTIHFKERMIYSKCSLSFHNFDRFTAACQDILTDCDQYSKEACQGVFKEWAIKNCPRRCGYCSSTFTGVFHY